MTDGSTTFENLAGVTFWGDQLAVVANVNPDGGDPEARLLLVDFDIETHTASVADDLTIPSLGGATRVEDVSSNGTNLFMTGNSLSVLASTYGEAFRAMFDGSSIQTTGLGVIPGKNVTDPLMSSQGIAVNSDGVVVGTSDGGRAIFEYDQQMEHAGDVIGVGVLFGVSDDRVKVGISSAAAVWEADNTTRRFVTDPTGRGTGLFAISPDHSRLLGSSDVADQGTGTVSEKLTKWTYEGVPSLIGDGAGGYVDGRFTGGTNADVGYYVASGPAVSPGDLLYIEPADTTLLVADWFESFSGIDLDAESSGVGPDVAFDYEHGVVAIISGSHAFLAKINRVPLALDDDYEAVENVPLVVSAPGVLDNDLDDSPSLSAVEVEAPEHGTLDLNADGSFTYTPDPDFNREDSFTYLATDGELSSEVVTVFITVDTPFPWYNGIEPLDVSDSGGISPLDALLGINSINSLGARELSQDRPRPLTQPFYDTSRNGLLSALDVLLVINYLNRRASGDGEGESDESLLLLSGDDVTATVPLSTIPVSSSGPEVTSDADTTGDFTFAWSGTPTLEIGFKPEAIHERDSVREWAAVSVNEDLEAVLDDLCEDLTGN